MIAKILLASIAIMLIDFVHAEYKVKNYCGLIGEGAKLPSMESCQTYYVCQANGDPIKAICPSGTVFSKNNQGCVAESDSDCIYGLSNPCQNKNNQFAANPKGCNWYCWCVNGAIKGEGTCNIGEIFDPANGQCINNNGACNSKDRDGVTNVCDIFQNGQFFGDSTDCSAWYQCKDMNLEKGFCESPLVFDVKTGYCLANDGNMCERTNNFVKNQASGPPKEPCTSPDQIVGDTNVCSIYYTCRRATNTPNTVYNWVPHTCANQYFDVISKQCSSTTLARPYPGCDRCQFQTGSWANAVDSTCATFFFCGNGQKVGTTLGTCRPGQYYNQDAGGCMDDFMLDQYESGHGACKDYSCTDERVCSMTAEDGGTTEGTQGTQTTKVTEPVTQTTTQTTKPANKPVETDPTDNETGKDPPKQ